MVPVATLDETLPVRSKHELRQFQRRGRVSAELP